MGHDCSHLLHRNATKGETTSEKQEYPPETELVIEELHLCFTCLDENMETNAFFVGPDDIMYRRMHYNALLSEVHKAAMKHVAEKCKQVLPG